MPPSLFKKQNKLAKTLIALDTLQERYGTGIWHRAKTLKTKQTFKARTSGYHYDHET
jgi:hypothetical protein